MPGQAHQRHRHFYCRVAQKLSDKAVQAQAAYALAICGSEYFQGRVRIMYPDVRGWGCGSLTPRKYR